MGPSGAVRPALNIDLGEDIDTGMLQQSPSCLLMLQYVWHVSQEVLLVPLHMCKLSSKQAGLCIQTPAFLKHKITRVIGCMYLCSEGCAMFYYLRSFIPY